MGFDTEFSLKHANNPDTLVIDHFYFKDGYPNQLEAEVTDNGFRIADLQIMGVMQVETNVEWLTLFSLSQDFQRVKPIILNM